MSGLQGFKESISHVIYSIVFSLIINTVPPLFHVNSGYIVLFNILYAIITLVLIIQLANTGYAYLIGWVFGIIFLVYGGILGTGLLGIIELIVDLSIPMIAIILKHFVLEQNEYD